MNIDQIRQKFQPALDEIVNASGVNDQFVDKDRFRVYIATVWGNAVLSPNAQASPRMTCQRCMTT